MKQFFTAKSKANKAPLVRPNHRRKELSSYRYFISLILLLICGMITSTYLAISHYRNYNDIEYRSFCAISRSLNCDTVSQSPYAIFLGAPLAVWGVLGYAFYLFVMFFFHSSKNTPQVWAASLVVSGLFCMTSLYLAGISAFFIHSYCLMCIVTYGINFIVLYVSWLAMKRFGNGSLAVQLKTNLAFIKRRFHWAAVAGCAFLLIMGSIILFFPSYWTYKPLSIEAQLSTGVTDEGSPWIGAKKPSLTIVEFTDYMCFQCGKMHHYLRQLVSQHPEQIRLVHKHFPLDSQVNPMLKRPVHPNAGVLSLFAIVAQKSGRFWQVNDQLFKDARDKKINIGKIAKDNNIDISDFNGMINDTHVVKMLEEDIRAGLKLGITATPSYLIDGNIYSGTVPDYILSTVTKKQS